MTKRIKWSLLTMFAIAALAGGGTAVAAAGKGHSRHHSHTVRHAPVRHAAETPGETSNESSGESGSEAPGNDGPGGHADEPGNANADHQFQGEE
jgi:hypothetical protein